MNWLKNFFNNVLGPFLSNLARAVVKAEAQALAPIAAEAVGLVGKTLIGAANSGSTANLGSALSQIISMTANEAAKVGLKAGASAILGAVGNELAKNPLTADNLAVK